MLTLSDSEQAALNSVLKKYTTRRYRAVVFGSRANGQAQKYSDIDLALIGSRPVPLRTIASLCEALENSSLPYTVDVVDFAKASPALKKEIEKNGIDI